MERPHDPDLSEAAETLFDLRKEKKRIGDEEKIQVEKIVHLMEERGMRVYADDELGITVHLQKSSKVTIQRESDDDERGTQRVRDAVDDLRRAAGGAEVTISVPGKPPAKVH